MHVLLYVFFRVSQVLELLIILYLVAVEGLQHSVNFNEVHAPLSEGKLGRVLSMKLVYSLELIGKSLEAFDAVISVTL